MAKKAKAKRNPHPRSADGDDKQIGIRIREARLARQLSQAELGEKLGLSFQQVQKYEKGTNRISARVSVIVCKALDIDPNYLLGWESTVKIDYTPHSDIFILSNEFSKLDNRLRSALLTFSRSMIKQGFTAEE